jgi:hypothetical protein
MSEDQDTPIEPFCLISESVRGERPRPEPATFLQPTVPDGQAPPAARNKLCCTCRRLLPVDQFHGNRGMPDGLEKRCKECRLVASKRTYKRAMADPERRAKKARSCKEYRERYPEKVKEWNRKMLLSRTEEYNRNAHMKCVYGITTDEYDEMFRLQDGVCATCGRPETRKNRHRGICRLHIDHDHVTGKVRGLLCCKCNWAIGGVNEDTEILRKMIEYLERFKAE